MSKNSRLLFISLLIVFIYHLIRDIFQIYSISHPLIDIWHRNHLWCKPYCNYITLPSEIFIIIASVVILRRNRVGLLGKIVLFSLIFWPFALLLP
ncbi:hypothetical protein A2Y99_01465 [Candidatus Gottesmanbacteria bacterium RBG_13_37_7]|uniref:DUF4405 domain-containing protein n=1 Tax=Candidatus Gottesmanbacteria bacterium RBG_13_37_7 TaxID=1798369 RepID=A0A1F5YIJ5_9BACT|nr:MAG: hypothetical protein A2Y99_01465 [Candidatus Gottesmanbacteria bacterium RBG_13_37_7]